MCFVHPAKSHDAITRFFSECVPWEGEEPYSQNENLEKYAVDGLGPFTRQKKRNGSDKNKHGFRKKK